MLPENSTPVAPVLVAAAASAADIVVVVVIIAVLSEVGVSSSEMSMVFQVFCVPGFLERGLRQPFAARTQLRK